MFDYNWISGNKVYTHEMINVINPANGKVIGNVPISGKKEVAAAIEAASRAYVSWSKLTPSERGIYLIHWAENLLNKRDELALLMSEEQGKPINEARGEIEGSAQFIQWYAEEGKRIYGEVIPPSSRNQRITVIKQPVGVCGLITPWNFPGAMIARKVAPALAAGCTIIVKPASETPRIAIAMFDELMATKIPAGVANLVTGKASVISDALFEDKRVRKISFTGSTNVGKTLMKNAADQVKRISLELGGNAPVIVFPDSNLDVAAEKIVENKFENCGQMCNGINVIMAHKDIKEELINKIKYLVQRIKVGEGTKAGVQMGPLINEAALQRMEDLVKDAKEKGATVLTGGERIQTELGGYFYSPTILTDITEDMDLIQEEIFGPVAPIMTFEDEEEVIDFSNKSPYGLAAYFFTNDINRVYRISERLEYGMVGVNGTQLSVPQAPFGGMKESGMGREGGHFGLDEFVELKYISLTLQ
ncbi:NAD-dependent succinate-semialdehyde dehydrogenase [Siminovitchia fortis]|uniref:NAD-dependent succinate-semialdehyde dehydrogenase n=2 Tax=Siminovitchia fortis TaxID=254758 RepID=A0A443IZ58_9BACI|nr:NAD-dependent succinate-semialdehyde dehydrogenase [Siminovitchia fortis]RWR13558.1 NAD-dependent succinate-semialdehyde dehydrogenase [Siminovitchia fortis]WHY83818.1 NAD-dependent succinate-semialdehyde dehydrogenase [Siminovitchia fortis]